MSKEHFTIGELNHATGPGTDVPKNIRDFTFNCVQCGRCVPVCPAGARRDYMVLFIKHKLRDVLPSEYRNYLSMKGPFVSTAGKLQQRIYSSVQKMKYRDLAPFMETTRPIPAPVPSRRSHSTSSASPTPSSSSSSFSSVSPSSSSSSFSPSPSSSSSSFSSSTLPPSYSPDNSSPTLSHPSDTSPPPSSLLFYPGCYIYNTTLTRRQIRLLGHIGESYVVLGGLTTCCGVPQLLQGEFDLADRCLDSLHEKIMKARPKIIVTSCAECLEALLRIRAKHHEDFEVLSVLEYLMRHADRFPKVKLRGKVTLHDSCRITRRYHRGDSTREAIDRFCDRVEMEDSGQGTMCCYYWNFGHDPANRDNRWRRIHSAKDVAEAIACDCISCYEKYESFSDDSLEVLDVLQLFEEAIDAHQTDELGGGSHDPASDMGNGEHGMNEGGNHEGGGEP